MAGAKDKPAHVQVAEAGFGAAVEAKGFRRVSPAHWRLDGDGIVWRILIRPGSVLIDGSFEVFQGVFVEGLDELYANIRGHKRSERFAGTSNRAHSWSDLVNDIVGARGDEIEAAYEVELAEWRREVGIWRFIAYKPPIPDLRKEAWNIPYIQRDGPVGDRYFFALSSGPPEAVIAYVTEQWERQMYALVSDYPDREAVCRKAWGAGTYAGDFGYDIAFCAARLIGDFDQINAMAHVKFERAQQPVSFFRRENREDWLYWVSCDERRRRRRDGFYNRTRHQHALVSKREAIRDCKWLLERSERLDLRLSDPGIDWDFFKEHEDL